MPGLMFAVPELDTRLKNKDQVVALRLPELPAEQLAIAVDFLADHLLMDLALGGYIDHEVPADLGGTAEPPVSGEGPSPPVVVLDGSPGGDVVGSDRYAVLGELAERGLDLAPAAYSPTATHRVEVDPELPGGVQHRGARGEAPPVA